MFKSMELLRPLPATGQAQREEVTQSVLYSFLCVSVLFVSLWLKQLFLNSR